MKLEKTKTLWSLSVCGPIMNKSAALIGSLLIYANSKNRLGNSDVVNTLFQ